MRLLFYLLMAGNLALFLGRGAWPVTERGTPYPLSWQGGRSEASAFLERDSDGWRETEGTAQRCVAVGPFAEKNQVHAFLQRLRALDVEAIIYPVKLPAEPDFWVHLPTADRRSARRQLADLKSRGLDGYIVPSGDLENSISLGMHRDVGEAETLKTFLRQQGVNAQIYLVRKELQETWVLLGPREEQKLARSAWSTLVNEEFQLKQRQNSCSSVASQQNFL